MKANSRSDSLLLAYYGDDFTGSTDVIEALSRANIKTVLFLKPPSPNDLAKFPGVRAFGVAGGSRAMSPREMEKNLPIAFRALKASKARFIHYKTCSTFDSSPSMGSIGKAIELGRREFGQKVTPLVVGVPVLGRHVVFGNLFARSGLDTEPFRLDRHPTMSRHPVTPMDEADLRLHLSRQTELPIQLVDILRLRASQPSDAKKERLLTDFGSQGPKPIVLFDTLADEDLPAIGHCLAERQLASGQLFCVGSSGIEYALIAHWRMSGIVSREVKHSNRETGKLSSRWKRIVAISGSCSPVTSVQIERANESGFAVVACNSRLLADEGSRSAGVADALAKARKVLTEGRNIIFHTSLGATDRRRAGFQRSLEMYSGRTAHEKLSKANASLANGLAEILQSALLYTGAGRGVVCGGDTSTHVARALGIQALEFVAPFAPGAPVCRVHAANSNMHGRQLIFKGGQVGRNSFFADLANNEQF
jgi:uncharacterized protein YgbK (DUF1537 family)